MHYIAKTMHIKKYFQRLSSIFLIIMTVIAKMAYAPSFLTMDQFYDGTHNGKQVLRDSMIRAIELCYEIQAHSSEVRATLYDSAALLAKMNSAEPKIWSDVRRGVYNTGAYEWWTAKTLSLFTSVKLPKQNSKPFVIAYTKAIKHHHPLLLVAFPGMQADGADFVTVSKFFSKIANDEQSSNPVRCGAGFVDAAQSAIDNGLFIMMKEIINANNNSNFENVQVVFSGHSLGGAVASLCALKYMGNKKNLNNQVLLITLGQPKTIKKGYEQHYNAIVGENNYRRLVTFSKNWSAKTKESDKDPVSGFKNIKDSDKDSAGCCHAGKRYKLYTEIKVEKWTQRFKLHPLEEYEKGMKKKPDNQKPLEVEQPKLEGVKTELPSEESDDALSDKIRKIVCDAMDLRMAALDDRVKKLEVSMLNLSKLNIGAKLTTFLDSIQGLHDTKATKESMITLQTRIAALEAVVTAEPAQPSPINIAQLRDAVTALQRVIAVQPAPQAPINIVQLRNDMDALRRVVAVQPVPNAPIELVRLRDAVTILQNAAPQAQAQPNAAALQATVQAMRTDLDTTRTRLANLVATYNGHTHRVPHNGAANRASIQPTQQFH